MTIGPVGRRSRGHEVRMDVAGAGVRRGHGPSSWRAAWRLTNEGREALTVTEAWHPHGRFRSSRRARSLRIAPGRSAKLEVLARSEVPPGSVVENCFLILRVTSARQRWRVLARFTLRVGEDGTPRPAVEAIDVHPAAR